MIWLYGLKPLQKTWIQAKPDPVEYYLLQTSSVVQSGNPPGHIRGGVATRSRASLIRPSRLGTSTNGRTMSKSNKRRDRRDHTENQRADWDVDSKTAYRNGRSRRPKHRRDTYEAQDDLFWGEEDY